MKYIMLLLCLVCLLIFTVLNKTTDKKISPPIIEKNNHQILNTQKNTNDNNISKNITTTSKIKTISKIKSINETKTTQKREKSSYLLFRQHQLQISYQKQQAYLKHKAKLDYLHKGGVKSELKRQKQLREQALKKRYESNIIFEKKAREQSMFRHNQKIQQQRVKKMQYIHEHQKPKQ